MSQLLGFVSYLSHTIAEPLTTIHHMMGAFEVNMFWCNRTCLLNAQLSV